MRQRIVRFFRQRLGFYVPPTQRERLYTVVSRSRVERTGRGDRGEFTLFR